MAFALINICEANISSTSIANKIQPTDHHGIPENLEQSRILCVEARSGVQAATLTTQEPTPHLTLSSF
jgi:hypothetical protein